MSTPEQTSGKTSRILIVEDDAIVARMISRALTGVGHTVRICGSAEDALVITEQENYDLILTDLIMAGMDGLDLIQQLRPKHKDVPIILLTANGSADITIRAAKSGAFDYLSKPFEMRTLLPIVDLALKSNRRGASAAMPLLRANTTCQIVGNSRAMQEVCKTIGRLADNDITVLIRGETGVGKELVARALHEYSGRKNGPFVAINCVAIPETLLESELFGHERGAFTGATSRRTGKFEQAHMGTLFLDEIGDINLETQGKLLRVLQERSIQRVGGQDGIHVNVRVLSATNRNLEEAIAAKYFREDLFYRLNGVTINIPPLRERKEDLPELIQVFLERTRKDPIERQMRIASDALQLLEEHRWPGNVRELENLIHRAVTMTNGSTITRESIYAAFSSAQNSSSSESPTIRECVSRWLNKAEFENCQNVYHELIETVERELYALAIQRAQGNLSKVSEWLGVSRPTARQKLIRFRLTPADSDASADKH
ncbi:MAG: sigma-54-dependent Fis family transcriptional regulator [Pedosphaera sp.]|nr:sigma-54-dependent Fis family transcriptional regulator [Pedosphaera sp.]